jgi:hypothetical protein
MASRDDVFPVHVAQHLLLGILRERAVFAQCTKVQAMGLRARLVSTLDRARALAVCGAILGMRGKWVGLRHLRDRSAGRALTVAAKSTAGVWPLSARCGRPVL